MVTKAFTSILFLFVRNWRLSLLYLYAYHLQAKNPLINSQNCKVCTLIKYIYKQIVNNLNHEKENSICSKPPFWIDVY